MICGRFVVFFFHLLWFSELTQQWQQQQLWWERWLCSIIRRFSGVMECLQSTIKPWSGSRSLGRKSSHTNKLTGLAAGLPMVFSHLHLSWANSALGLLFTWMHHLQPFGEPSIFFFFLLMDKYGNHSEKKIM